MKKVQQKVRKNNWERQRPGHIGVLKAKAENAWSDHPSNQTVASVEKSCWIHSPPWPPDFARDPSVHPRSTQRTHHTVWRLSACFSAPGKGRGTCLTAPWVNGWTRWSTQSRAPASLKLALQGVKEDRSPGCCSDECPIQGTLKSGRCMLKAGFELHLESGNLRLHSSSNRFCQPISSGQEPGCSQGFFLCLFRN